MRTKTRISVIAGALALAVGLAGNAQAGTLEDVQARGTLNCVVSTGIAGFAYPDDAGEWHGFDIDFCRATAAAVLGDPGAIKAVTSTGKTRFTTLNAGEGDMVWRNDIQHFSRKEHGQSAPVCIQTGTTTELNLADYFHANGMKYEAVTIETNDEARQNYTAGRCDVYTTDASGLAATAVSLAATASTAVEAQWPYGDWPAAEAGFLGISVATCMDPIVNADDDDLTGNACSEAKDPEVLRLFALEGNQGAELGLSADWAYNIIKSVGSYGELVERNIGERSIGFNWGLSAPVRQSRHRLPSTPYTGQ